MPSRTPHLRRAFFERVVLPSVASLALTFLPVTLACAFASPARAQEMNNNDPSELFVKAFTSVQQGEKLELDGRLKPALAKYRFAASLLEQLGQTNPNWQPLIVRYRVRKTTENIQKLEEKLNSPPNVPDAPSVGTGPTVALGSNRGSTRPGSASDPAEDDPLPASDEPSAASTGNPGNSGVPSRRSAPPSTESFDRTATDLRVKLDKTQKDLTDAVGQLKAAQADKKQALREREDIESQLKKQAVRERQDLEFQLHSMKSGTVAAQKRLERIRADRDDLQAQVAKAEAKLKDAKSKSTDDLGASKELRAQVAELKKSLARAQADTKAAGKTKEELEKKVAESEGGNAKLTKERDEAAARGDQNKDAAARIQVLEAENAILTQKLTVAETSIAELHAETAKKKEELDGVRKELGALQEQLVASRDQNDRSATTVTELRKQLDENAEQLTQLKAKGLTSEDAARMTKENELLRGIVMRQLKDQARRDRARELLTTELARLEVQSKTLNEQVDVLGRPTVQLSDEERALFKDPQLSISDDSNDPNAMALSITELRPRAPASATGALTGQTSAAEAPPNAASLAAPPGPPAPKVETVFTPKVAEALVPLAREAKDDFDGGRYVEAEKTYDKLLAREPKNPYLLSNQGVVLFRQDKLKLAEVMLRKATALAPKDAFSQATLGIVYYRMHRYDEAITSLTQAIQLDPKNATAHNYLGITSSQKGWPEAAIDEIQKAIALNPNYADAHFNIAVIYATNQPPAKDRAEEHYKIATSLGATPDPALEKLIRN